METFLDPFSPVISTNNLDPTDQSNVLMLSKFMMERYQLNYDFACSTALKILAEQKKIDWGLAITFEASDILQARLLVTKERVHFLGKQIGEGTHSVVFESQVVPTTRHDKENVHFSPGKPVKTAVKKTKKCAKEAPTFTPEKKKLKTALPHCTQGIDIHLDTFRDTDGFGYSMNVFRDYNLSQIDFSTLNQPVVCLLNVLMACSQGLANLHDTHTVHRDVKGANILVSAPSQRENTGHVEISVLTDFGTLKVESSDWHNTSGTVVYLDPSMFGSEKDCLLNQKKRWGRQTQEGDVYALGVTIFYDTLCKLIEGLCKRLPAEKVTEIEMLRQPLLFKISSGPFSVEDLHERGIGYRTTYGVDDKEREWLYELPVLDLIYTNLATIFSQCTAILTTKEIDALIQLSKLSCAMQHLDLEWRPDMHQVIAWLTQILHCLETPSAEKKRALDLDELDFFKDAPPRKKARHLTEVAPKSNPPAAVMAESLPIPPTMPYQDDEPLGFI